MKTILSVLTMCFITTGVSAFTPIMKSIKLNDGEEITARICLPDNEVKTIVFCIHGTGPGTYLTKRQTFNFCDELAKGFCEQGAAFFTYNRRGCENGNTPPYYVDVDSVKYVKYTPQQEAEDVEAMIKSLSREKQFMNCKMLLYGMSEGTVIAALVAERRKVKVDALLLHGYAHDNMFDIIKWQDEGNGVMIIANSIFDRNNDKLISREEYEENDEQTKRQKTYLFQDMAFDSLDVVKDGFIDIKDIGKMRAPFHEHLMKCVEHNDGSWIKNHYFNITPQWFKKHFELEPNKTRLLRVDVPIHVFHGVDDANVPVESLYDLQSRFKVCNKTNLTIHVFEKHNHDLNFADWLTQKRWSEGLKEIFIVARNM